MAFNSFGLVGDLCQFEGFVVAARFIISLDSKVQRFVILDFWVPRDCIDKCVDDSDPGKLELQCLSE